jgi:hypothetical protein
MDNVSFLDVTNALTGEIVTHAIIDRGNAEFSSMIKSTYDEMIAQREASPL